MKAKYIVLFLVVSIHSYLSAQIYPIEDVQHIKPEKGLMRRETITTEDTIGKPSYMSEIKYYNEDGYETWLIQLNSNGDTTKQIKTYYLGNGLELTLYIEKNRLDSAYEQYNEKNCLAYDVWLMGPEEPSDKDTTIYYYDSNGNFIKMDERYWKNTEVYNYKNNQIISVVTTDADVDYEEGEKPETYTSTTYKYLEGGKKIEMVDYIGSNKLYSKTYVTLNQKNHPTLLEDYKYADGTKNYMQYKKEYYYHSNGLIKLETVNWYEEDYFKWSSTRSYNEKGQVTEYIFKDEKNGKKTTQQHKYYYK